MLPEESFIKTVMKHLQYVKFEQPYQKQLFICNYWLRYYPLQYIKRLITLLMKLMKCKQKESELDRHPSWSCQDMPYYNGKKTWVACGNLHSSNHYEQVWLLTEQSAQPPIWTYSCQSGERIVSHTLIHYINEWPKDPGISYTTLWGRYVKYRSWGVHAAFC